MAGLPFNPMSFVTPYSAVSTANPGAAFGNALAQAKQSKISEGYLANAQRQQGVNEQRYGQEELDKARQQLDSALMSGNQDAVELSANNLRAIASRYGYSLAETRSDAQLRSGVATPVGKQEAEPGSEENPIDIDAYDAKQGAVRVPGGSLPQLPGKAYKPTEAESNARIDESLKTGGNQLMGAETTQLPAAQEKAFQAWAKKNGITDVNDPQAHYDYRGFWLSGGDHKSGDHFPDTFKQHGHETFSEESAYSSGPGDGGRWNGEQFSPPQRSAFTGNMAPSIRPPGGSLPASPIAEPPGASEAPLRGYTLNGPDGKPIYSVAPKDVLTNQQKRAMGVFEGLASKTKDPQELQWLDQARAETEKLVGVMPLEEAVKTGLAHYIGQMNSRDKMAMVEANHKRFGGGGGGGAMLGKGSDAAESVQIYDDNATHQTEKIQEEDRQYGAIEDAINSGDPSVQRDAINQLLKIRSGSAVTAAEDARISRINGLMPQLSSMFGQWTGGQMSPEMVNTIRQIVTMKRAANSAKIERIYKHQADLYTVQNKRKVKDPTVVEERAKVLEEGGKPIGAPAKAHLWE